MRVTNRLAFWVSLSALVLLSCNKGGPDSDGTRSLESLQVAYSRIPEVASMDGNTKTAYSNLKYEVNWSEGDDIAIFNKTTGTLYHYTLTAGSGTTSATFTYAAYPAPTFGVSDELYAVYPFDAASVDAGSLYVSIYRDASQDTYASASNQAFTRNDILVSDKFTLASMSGSEATPLSLSNMNRMVHLVVLTTTVSNESVKTQPVKQLGIKSKGIAGKALVDLSGSSPVLAVNSGDEDEAVITIPGTPAMSYKDYLVRFVPVFPVNIAQSPNNGLSFVLYNDDVEAGFHRALSYTLAAGSSTQYFLSDGLFGGNPLAKESAAIYDYSWWYTPKNYTGNYEGDGAFMGGNNAGQFAE